MKIGIDIMGGDYAPEEIVLGAISACEGLADSVKLVLIGDEKRAKAIINEAEADISSFDFVHTTQVIEMGEHPAKTFSKKADSSIAVGFKLLQNKQINSFASAGNTGAMLIGAMITVKPVQGVIRPSIAAFVPRTDGKFSVLLDVGLNADCKSDVLLQFGILGTIYSNKIFGIEKPKVGLLNIGAEAEKGNLVVRSAHEMMSISDKFDFIGNIEGSDIFSCEKADVIVCEGFVGNIVLKQIEGFYSQIKERKVSDEYFDKFNFENIGGTPILGINAPVIIGHGVSKSKAVKNMIFQAHEVIKADLTNKYKETFQ